MVMSNIQKFYPLASLLNNAEDILISLSNPQPAVPEPKKSIKFICSLLVDDDYDFPFIDFHAESKTWVIESKDLVYNGKVLWKKATHSPATIVRLFRQFGWIVSVLNWEGASTTVVEKKND